MNFFSAIDQALFRLCVPIGRFLHWLTGASTAAIGAFLWIAGMAMYIGRSPSVFWFIVILPFNFLYLWLYVSLDRHPPTVDTLSIPLVFLLSIRLWYNGTFPFFFVVDVISPPSLLRMGQDLVQLLSINIATMLWPRRKSVARRAVEKLLRKPVLEPAMNVTS